MGGSRRTCVIEKACRKALVEMLEMDEMIVLEQQSVGGSTLTLNAEL